MPSPSLLLPFLFVSVDAKRKAALRRPILCFLKLQSGLATDCNAAGVDYADTDGLEYRPAEAEAIHLVVRDNFNVLADWHDTDHVGLCAAEDAAEGNELADDDVSGEQLGIETGLEDLAVGNRINLGSRRTSL